MKQLLIIFIRIEDYSYREVIPSPPSPPPPAPRREFGIKRAHNRANRVNTCDTSPAAPLSSARPRNRRASAWRGAASSPEGDGGSCGTHADLPLKYLTTVPDNFSNTLSGNKDSAR